MQTNNLRVINLFFKNKKESEIQFLEKLKNTLIQNPNPNYLEFIFFKWKQKIFVEVNEAKLLKNIDWVLPEMNLIHQMLRLIEKQTRF